MSDPQEAATPQRLDPAFKADLIDFARERIQMVWNDVPGGVDAATLASNVVAAQEFLWMSLQVPVSATPSDPHSAEAPMWRDAWRTFQDPYLYPDAKKFPSPFESFVAGFMAARTARDAEVAELKAKIADAWDEGLSAGCDRWADSREFGDPPINPYRSASSPVEGGN